MRTLLSLALLCAIGATAAHAVEVGEQGPNFKFDKSWNFDAAITELDQLRGKVIMVESWATW